MDIDEYWLEEKDIHWAYFLTLEEDLHRLSRFIELSEENFDTHSIECSRILISCCSETEVVLKLAAGLGKGKSLKSCHKKLGKNSILLSSSKVIVRRSGLEIKPWEKWSEDQLPEWWISHNTVKHDRSNKYRNANLKNAIYSICALFSATLLYLRMKGTKAVFPGPKMLRINSELGTHDMTCDGSIISFDVPNPS